MSLLLNGTAEGRLAALWQDSPSPSSLHWHLSSADTPALLPSAGPLTCRAFTSHGLVGFLFICDVWFDIVLFSHCISFFHYAKKYDYVTSDVKKVKPSTGVQTIKVTFLLKRASKFCYSHSIFLSLKCLWKC